MSIKPKFLFIHGAGGTSSKWRKVPEHVRNRSIIVDLPGRNDVPALSSTSIKEIASEVNKVIEEDVIVVGHSMGGIVAIELASQSHHVKGIVLCSSHYYLPVNQQLLAKLEEGIFPKGLFYASYHKSVDPALLKEEEEEIAKVPISTTYSDFLATNLFVDGKEKLDKLTIPVLVINGEEDRLIPPSATRELQELDANISIVILKNAGHYVMLEKSTEFMEALKEFRENVMDNRFGQDI